MIGDVIAARLGKALELSDLLASALTDARLRARNGAAKSNTIASQFWCIIGARESYARALVAGAWQGFDCSHGEIASVAALRAGLTKSKQDVLAALASAGPLDDARADIVLGLAEHEAQHHGQLIRYFYANDIAFPKAFAERYAL